MEILVYDPALEEKINNQGLDKEEYDSLISRYDFEKINGIKDVNIGPGADHWVVFMEIYAVGITLLHLGKNIEEGLNWWVEKGKKLKAIFQRKELIAVDENGAIALALNFLIEKQNEPIEAISIEDKHKIQLTDLSEIMGDGRDKDSIISQPHNLYILTILVNNWKNYVLAVQSDGNIEIIKCYEIASGFFEIKEN